MPYKLTIVSDITNAGHNEEVHEFDTFYELQDYVEEQTKDMSEDERELFMYNIKVEGELKWN